MEKSRVKKYESYRAEISKLVDYEKANEEPVLATKKDVKKDKKLKKESTANSLSLEELVNEFEDYKDPSGELRRQKKEEEKRIKREKTLIIVSSGVIIVLLLLGIIFTIVLRG